MLSTVAIVGIRDRFAGRVAVGLINSSSGSSGSFTLSLGGLWVGLLSTVAIVGIMGRFAGRVAVGLMNRFDKQW